MTIYVVDPSGGNDTNDGKDFFGFALTGATFTNSTKTLTKTGAFAGYTFNSGDRIAITGGTGVTVGYYAIASKTDNDNIVLVADIGGTNPTDVASSNGPWATTQKALDTVAAGDTVYLAATATETISAKIDLDTTSGSSAAVIRFFGRDGTNASSAATYTIASAAGVGANSLIEDASGTASDYTFHDIHLDATVAGTAGFRQLGGTVNGLAWVRCTFTGGTSANYWANGGDHTLIDCDFLSSGDIGIRADANRALFKVIGSRVIDPGGVGVRIRLSTYGFISTTVISNAGSDGILFDSGRLNWAMFNNTIDGSAGDAIDLGSGTTDRCQIAGNVLSNSGGYGINFAEHNSNVYAYNHFYNNTSGPTSYTASLADDFADPPGIGNGSGDPSYVDRANDDFTPGTGSPLILAAYSGQMNIGAVAHAAGGGGGGNSVTPFSLQNLQAGVLG